LAVQLSKDSYYLEGVVAYDLLGALKILRREGWFSVESYNSRLKNYKLFSYEQRDQPTPLRPELRQDKLHGNAMSLMVHLRQLSDHCWKLFFYSKGYMVSW
jgi:hypothetical protein